MLHTLQKKNMTPGVPLPVVAVRVVHALLTCYAAAIVIIVRSSPGYAAGFDASESWIVVERVFALAVTVPIFLGSTLAFLAATVRRLFPAAIFCCAFVAFSLIFLPAMASLSFSRYVPALGFALVYGLSALILARYYFSLPGLRKK